MEMGAGRFEINELPEQALYRHVGIYAYRRDFLLQFASWEPAPMEQLEKLEQLRALYHGVRIKAITVQHTGISIDTPEDLEKARRMFEENPLL
jgi:3-deoxy-manno-octulosonate cytidylyltransferase (CMP-KDO synthetase)